MLAEDIALNGMKVIQINTDGILVDCPKDKRSTLDSLCNQWMEFTQLKLDYDFFEIVAQRDVNNYLGKMTNGKIKLKGAYEILKDYHKNHSMQIVSQAVVDYFIKGIPVEKTIRECKDIYKFCLGVKSPSNASFEARRAYKGEIEIVKLNKTNRYYISNNGYYLYKINNSSTEKLHNYTDTKHPVTFKITPFNKYFESEDYDICYGFYIYEANKLISAIETTQLSLFYYEL